MYEIDFLEIDRKIIVFRYQISGKAVLSLFRDQAVHLSLFVYLQELISLQLLLPVHGVCMQYMTVTQGLRESERFILFRVLQFLLILV